MTTQPVVPRSASASGFGASPTDSIPSAAFEIPRPENEGAPSDTSSLRARYLLPVPFLSEAPIPLMSSDGVMLPKSEQTELFAFAAEIYPPMPNGTVTRDIEVNRDNLVSALMTLWAARQNPQVAEGGFTLRDFFTVLAMGEFCGAIEGYTLNEGIEALVRRYHGVGAAEDRNAFFRYISVMEALYGYRATRNRTYMLDSRFDFDAIASEHVDVVVDMLADSTYGYQRGEPYNWYNPLPHTREFTWLHNGTWAVGHPAPGTDVRLLQKVSFPNPACVVDPATNQIVLKSDDPNRCQLREGSASTYWQDYSHYFFIITDGAYPIG